MRLTRCFLALAALCSSACLSGGQKPNPLLLEAQAKAHAHEQEVLRLRGNLQTVGQDNKALKARVKLLESRLGEAEPELPHLKIGGPDWFFEAKTARWFSGPEEVGFETRLTTYTDQMQAHVVAFWATWCGPCVAPEELAQLARLQSELAKIGSALIGVAIDDSETLMNDPRVSRWHYPIWQRRDAHIEWLPEGLVRQAGVSLPMFLVVNQQGQVLYWRNAVLNDGARRDLVTAVSAARAVIAPPQPLRKTKRRSRRP